MPIINSYTGVWYVKMLTNNGSIASIDILLLGTTWYLGFKSFSENPNIESIVAINIFNTRMFSVCHHSLINYIVNLFVRQVSENVLS